jgi:hypothetical protein
MAESKKRGLIPREVLFGNPERTSPKLSPDGQYISWLAPNDKNVLQVFVRGINEPDSAATAVTNDKKVNKTE